MLKSSLLLSVLAYMLLQASAMSLAPEQTIERSSENVLVDQSNSGLKRIVLDEALVNSSKRLLIDEILANGTKRVLVDEPIPISARSIILQEELTNGAKRIVIEEIAANLTKRVLNSIEGEDNLEKFKRVDIDEILANGTKRVILKEEPLNEEAKREGEELHLAGKGDKRVLLNEEPSKKAVSEEEKNDLLVKKTIREAVEVTTEEVPIMEFKKKSILPSEEPIVINSILDNTLDRTIIEKLCQPGKTFKYFLPHPSNSSRFIQCDPWGSPVIRECESGKIWDEWSVECRLPTDIAVPKIDWSSLNENSTLPIIDVVFDCNLPASLCLNGGVCEREPVFNATWRCACVGNYTGDVCEVKIEDESLYSQILSDRFSIADYRKVLSELAVESADLLPQSNLTFFQQYKDLVDQDIYEQMIKYVELYSNGSIRYDTVINSLVEDLLKEIYPDAFFLSQLNVTSLSVLDVFNLVPNLLSYAKYSSQRYVQVFFQYKKALEHLEVELNSSSWPTIAQEAKIYSNWTNLYLNRRISALNESIAKEEAKEATQADLLSQEAKWSDVNVKEKLGNSYSELSLDSEKLFKILNDFQDKVLLAAKENKSVLILRLSESSVLGADKIIEVLEQIWGSSVQIWDALINFGFWSLTDAFVKAL